MTYMMLFVKSLKAAVLALELRNGLLHQFDHVINADGAGEGFEFVDGADC